MKIFQRSPFEPLLFSMTQKKQAAGFKLIFYKFITKKKEMNEGTKGGYQLGALRGGVTVPEGVQSQKVLKFCILMTSRGPNLWLSMTY